MAEASSIISIEASRIPIGSTSSNEAPIDLSCSVMPARLSLCLSMSVLRLLYRMDTSSDIFVILLATVFESYRVSSFSIISFAFPITTHKARRAWSPSAEIKFLPACWRCTSTFVLWLEVSTLDDSLVGLLCSFVNTSLKHLALLAAQTRILQRAQSLLSFRSWMGNLSKSIIKLVVHVIYSKI